MPMMRMPSVLRPSVSTATAGVLSIILIGAAHAQTATPRSAPTSGNHSSSPVMQRAQPEDAKAPVPPVVHRSALSNRRTADPIPVESWSQANRVVDEVGGWRSYLKEAHGMPAATEPRK